MHTTIKIAASVATCFLLTACEEIFSDPEGASTSLPALQVINGYFLSEITVTDASGSVRSNIQFSLDAAERRLTVAGMVNPRLSPAPGLSGNHQFDENGNWTRTRMFDTGVLYEDKSYFYDTAGKLSRTASFVGTSRELNEFFNYNAEGKLEAWAKTGAEGEAGGTVNTRFVYNDVGNVESATRQNPSLPGPGDIIYYYYDSNHQLLETQTDASSDGSINFRTTYSYNAEGNISQKINYNGAGAFTQATEYTYTATNDRVFNETLFLLRYYQQ